MSNLLLLQTGGPAYDWFTFTWWGIMAVIIFSLVYFLPKIIKKEENRLTTVKAFAIAGLLNHLSIVFFFLFRDGGISAGAAMDALFAIAPCNAMTWLMVIAFMFRDNSKPQKTLITFATYGTLIFGLITMFYPDFYPGATGFDFGFASNYGFWKSIIFHSIMVMTGSLALAFKIVKPRVKHGLLMLAGLFIGLYTYGWGVTTALSGTDHPTDIFYWTTFPLKDIFSVQFAILLVGIVVATIGLIVEIKTLPKEERTTTKICSFVKNCKRLNKITPQHDPETKTEK